MMTQRSAVSVQHSAMARLRRAFSLVEMVIVIGIIVVLVGLTVAVLGSLSRGAESRATQDMLTIVDSAYAEWKNVSERDITYGVDNVPPGVVYEITQQAVGVDDHMPTDEVLSDLMANATSKAMLANIQTELLRPANPPTHPEPKLQDSWETEVITVFPGRLWLAGFDAPALKDIDGTVRTEFENAFGVCVQRRIRFVSAGPDGQLGLVDPVTGAQNPLAADNLYSYPLEAP